MAVYNETVLSFGNVGGNIPNLHLVRAALSGGITFGMSDKRGTVRDCYSETVAGKEWIVQDGWITKAVWYNTFSQLAEMWVNVSLCLGSLRPRDRSYRVRDF